MIRLLAACLLGLGCQGEPVTSAPAACSPVPNNMLQNPSFEIVSGGVLTGWVGDPAEKLTQKTGGAAHCNAWAEVALAAPGDATPRFWGQVVNLETTIKKGTRVVATAYVRSLDAHLDIGFLIGSVSGPSTEKAFTLPADGSWKKLEHEWVVPEDITTTLFVSVSSTVKSPRALGVDQVTLVAIP